MTQEALVKISNVKKHFPIKGGLLQRQIGQIKAVDGVSFSIQSGETLGLVGESGCGKTTIGKVILRLHEATEGKILFEGKDILKLNKREMRDVRREMQIIYQDPNSSLDPRLTVAEIVGEPLRIHGLAKGKEREKEVKRLLDLVGLSSYHASRYPHEFSGGQRQRIGIARALALNPKLIVCDEPVSALDVSIQSQIINLLQDLQTEFNLTYLFIAHGLAVVKHISNRVGVMYLGKLVEIASSEEIFANAVHPYTIALMSAIPIPDPEFSNKRIILEGDVPSPINPPKGCRFHTRCPKAQEMCKEIEPELLDIGQNHHVACHFVSAATD